MEPDSSQVSAERQEKARLFFALWPDEAVRSSLHGTAVDCARRFGGRAMAPQTLHLTLAFMGDVAVERLGELQSVGSAVVAEVFDLALDCLGYWHHNRILWAGSRLSQPGLAQLSADLAGRLEAQGYATGLKKGRVFTPHITLVRKVVDQRPALPPFPPLVWPCRDFSLVRSRLSSQGAAYDILARWPLG